MFGLLSPLWLAALAALAVPIAVHLWSRRAGRTIRVGSIRFLEESPARFRSLRLNDPWLLLLRLAVVTCVVLLLAGPVLRSDTTPRPVAWVLVEPELLGDPQVLAGDPVLDSLRRAGASIRMLAPGFEEVRMGGAPRGDARVAPTRASGRSGIVPNYWSLLREADDLVPAGSRLYVVAPARLAHVRGERPRLRSSVVWHAPATTAPHWWIERARLGRGDSLHVVLGTARDGTGWLEHVAWPAGSSDTIVSGERLPSIAAWRGADARYRLRLVGDDEVAHDTVTADADTARHVIIHAASDRDDDARYLAAAFRALGEATGDAADVRIADPATAFDTRSGDWIVRLGNAFTSDSAAPLTGGATLLTDAADGRGMRTDSWIVSTGGVRGAELLRRGGADSSGAPVWTDGFGTPILTAARAGEGGVHYRFLGRFDPAWTGLVLDARFPEALATLWTAPERAEPRFDARRITLAQLVPAALPAPRGRPAATPAPRSLALPLLLLTLLLFLAERWTATRRPR